MTASLREFLSADHQRLDVLLAKADRADGSIDEESFSEFRQGLLWHIGVEERVLFPEMRRAGRASALAEQLHRDHAALSALLVPPPTRERIAQIRELLTEHNPLEENEGGLYAIVEQMEGAGLALLLERIRSTPPVRLAGYSDTPLLARTTEELLRKAKEGRLEFHRNRRGDAGSGKPE